MNYDNTKTYFENDFGKSFANYFNMNYHYMSKTKYLKRLFKVI